VAENQSVGIWRKNDCHIKLVNVYFQPDNALEIEERLMVTLHKIRQAEPGVNIIVGGDFNQPLHDVKNRTRTNIEKCNMHVCQYEEESFHRNAADGTTKSSRIDYIATTKELHMKTTRVLKKTMSDHNVVMVDVVGRNGLPLTPRRTNNKEMFFSNLLNEIKQKHIKFYLRYAVQMISLVMNKD